MNSFVANRRLDESRAEAPNGFSDSTRAARFARWERVGVELVRADIRNGGRFVVGGGPRTRALADEWLRLKDAEKAENTAASRKSSWDKKPMAGSIKRMWGQVTDRLERAIHAGLHQH
jgi:hypothetical protein